MNQLLSKRTSEVTGETNFIMNTGIRRINKLLDEFETYLVSTGRKKSCFLVLMLIIASNAVAIPIMDNISGTSVFISLIYVLVLSLTSLCKRCFDRRPNKFPAIAV